MRSEKNFDDWEEGEEKLKLEKRRKNKQRRSAEKLNAFNMPDTPILPTVEIDAEKKENPTPERKSDEIKAPTEKETILNIEEQKSPLENQKEEKTYEELKESIEKTYYELETAFLSDPLNPNLNSLNKEKLSELINNSSLLSNFIDRSSPFLVSLIQEGGVLHDEFKNSHSDPSSWIFNKIKGLAKEAFKQKETPPSPETPEEKEELKEIITKDATGKEKQEKDFYKELSFAVGRQVAAELQKKGYFRIKDFVQEFKDQALRVPHVKTDTRVIEGIWNRILQEDIIKEEGKSGRFFLNLEKNKMSREEFTQELAALLYNEFFPPKEKSADNIKKESHKTIERSFDVLIQEARKMLAAGQTKETSTPITARNIAFAFSEKNLLPEGMTISEFINLLENQGKNKPNDAVSQETLPELASQLNAHESTKEESLRDKQERQREAHSAITESWRKREAARKSVRQRLRMSQPEDINNMLEDEGVLDENNAPKGEKTDEEAGEKAVNDEVDLDQIAKAEAELNRALAEKEDGEVTLDDIEQAFDEENEQSAEETEEEKSDKPKIELETSETSNLQQALKKFNLTAEDMNQVAYFNELSEGQKLLVLENLRQITLGRIQEAALDYQHSSVSVGFLSRIWKGITKHYQIAAQEKEEAKKIEAGGIEIYGKILQQLVNGMRAFKTKVDIKNNTLEAQYANKENYGELDLEQEQIINDFNKAAMAFSRMPYEWQFSTGKQHKEYERVHNEYVAARDKLLSDVINKYFKKTVINKYFKKTFANVEKISAKTSSEIFKIDREVQFNQFLNTNPEVEKELQKIKNKRVWAQAMKDTLFERGIYTGAGFISRAATVSLLGVMGIPFAAAITGGYFSARRADKTLKEQAKMGRYGKGVEREENYEYVGARHLKKRLEDITGDLLETDSTIDEEQIEGGQDKNKTKESLKLRINYTLQKIENGLVNFGSENERIANQYELMEALAKAKSVVDFIFYSDKGEEKRCRLEKFLTRKYEKVAKQQDKFLFKQMRNGMVLSAGFATLGHLIHWSGEKLFWDHKAGAIAGSGQNISSQKNILNKDNREILSSAKKASPTATLNPSPSPTPTKTFPPSPTIESPTPTHTPPPSPTEIFPSPTPSRTSHPTETFTPAPTATEHLTPTNTPTGENITPEPTKSIFEKSPENILSKPASVDLQEATSARGYLSLAANTTNTENKLVYLQKAADMEITAGKTGEADSINKQMQNIINAHRQEFNEKQLGSLQRIQSDLENKIQIAEIGSGTARQPIVPEQAGESVVPPPQSADKPSMEKINFSGISGKRGLYGGAEQFVQKFYAGELDKFAPNSSEYRAALVHHADRIKDLLAEDIKNTGGRRFGLEHVTNPDKISAEQFNKIKWDEVQKAVEHDKIFHRELKPEEVENIVKQAKTQSNILEQHKSPSVSSVEHPAAVPEKITVKPEDLGADKNTTLIPVEIPAEHNLLPNEQLMQVNDKFMLVGVGDDKKPFSIMEFPQGTSVYDAIQKSQALNVELKENNIPLAEAPALVEFSGKNNIPLPAAARHHFWLKQEKMGLGKERIADIIRLAENQQDRAALNELITGDKDYFPYEDYENVNVLSVNNRQENFENITIRYRSVGQAQENYDVSLFASGEQGRIALDGKEVAKFELKQAKDALKDPAGFVKKVSS